MVEINSNFIDVNSYVAKHDRIRWQDILTEGIVASGHFEVTEKATPDMGVTVAAGRAYIEGDDATDQGFYYAYSTSSNNLTISAADPTNDRIDRVVLQVYDSTDISGDTEDKVELEVLTGTPAASPSAPPTPDNAISLATVDVGAGVTSITNADITDTRSQFALSGDVVNLLATLAGNNIFTGDNTFNEPVTIDKADGTAPLVITSTTKVSNLNADKVDGYDASDLLTPEDGWLSAGETWTYASSDDPTYTVTISGDKTSKYSAGMRVKLTDSGTQYFIITKVVYSDPNTILTLYGGTDYDLSGGAITNPYYSTQKAPQGFPLDPDKWTVEVTDTTQREQTSPAIDTWYNLGSVSIDIPVGVWVVEQSLCAGGDKSGESVRCRTTLSTANNTESNSDFSTNFAGYGTLHSVIFKSNKLTCASKTTYYLNTLTATASVTKIYNLNNLQKLFIRARYAYL